MSFRLNVWIDNDNLPSFRDYSVKDLQTLGPTETKLLYTLHWILLFASAECADEEVDAKLLNDSHSHLFSIPTISLFVYLFAPIVHHLKESDFQNYRLENGIKLWHGMWEFSPPYGAPCFTAPVKPKARQLFNSLLSPRESLDSYCPNRKYLIFVLAFDNKMRK